MGQTLTAATTGITDADGLTSPNYTYHIRVDRTADIAAARAPTLVAADLNPNGTFADDLPSETLTSAARRR